MALAPCEEELEVLRALEDPVEGEAEAEHGKHEEDRDEGERGRDRERLARIGIGDAVEEHDLRDAEVEVDGDDRVHARDRDEPPERALVLGLLDRGHEELELSGEARSRWKPYEGEEEHRERERDERRAPPEGAEALDVVRARH